MEDLQQAYAAYQQALYHLRDPKVSALDQYPPQVTAHSWQEPKLWYGIGILYDRYGSLEHAEEAFSQVMHMQPDFEKANEIYFRLGIIYKQQQKYEQSLDVCDVLDLIRAKTNPGLVLQIYCSESSKTLDRGGYLVSDWPRPRAAQRRGFPAHATK